MEAPENCSQCPLEHGVERCKYDTTMDTETTWANIPGPECPFVQLAVTSAELATTQDLLTTAEDGLRSANDRARRLAEDVAAKDAEIGKMRGVIKEAALDLSVNCEAPELPGVECPQCDTPEIYEEAGEKYCANCGWPDEDFDHPSPVEAETCDMPAAIFFFPNGNTAVCDRRGEQMPKYQRGHAESIDLLAADGIDWRDIPERHGRPITIKSGRG